MNETPEDRWLREFREFCDQEKTWIEDQSRRTQHYMRELKCMMAFTMAAFLAALFLWMLR